MNLPKLDELLKKENIELLYIQFYTKDLNEVLYRHERPRVLDYRLMIYCTYENRQFYTEIHFSKEGLADTATANESIVRAVKKILKKALEGDDNEQSTEKDNS